MFVLVPVINNWLLDRESKANYPIQKTFKGPNLLLCVFFFNFKCFVFLVHILQDKRKTSGYPWEKPSAVKDTVISSQFLRNGAQPA